MLLIWQANIKGFTFLGVRSLFCMCENNLLTLHPDIYRDFNPSVLQSFNYLIYGKLNPILK